MLLVCFYYLQNKTMSMRRISLESCISQEMEFKKNHFYVNVLEFRNWGYDGEMVAAPKRHDNANQ